MKIDWDWKNEPRKLNRFLGWFRHKPVPNHMSNHYRKEHFS